MLGGEVAEVEGAGAVVGELVRGGAPYAEGGCGAGYDDDFVFYAPVIYVKMAGLARLVRSLLMIIVAREEVEAEGRVEGECNTYGPAESPAIRRILGMSSKEPSSAGLTASCSLRAWRRCLETEVMLGFLRALRNCWSWSDGIVV